MSRYPTSLLALTILFLSTCSELCLLHNLAAQEAEEKSKTSEETKVLRIGMIGLDTSHCPAFTKLINAEDAEGNLAKMRVTAAFPGGSPDIASSRDRIEGFTEQLSAMGVEIVDSIEELLPKVDAILLESVDGRKHLSQVLPVFRAGKPVFIDKPLAASLEEAIAIDLLAKKYKARWFSSSSLRFSPEIAKFRSGEHTSGDIVGASAWSPCALEKTHSDLFWYGVHGVETLFTAMGTGCKSVTRTFTEDLDLVAGTWEDGRIGTFRGIRKGKTGYGMVVFGSKWIDSSAKYQGYAPLVDEIAEFFLGGEPPVNPEETLEMFTFMQAADVSKEQGGQPVQLDQVWAEALQAAEKRILILDQP
ncbi:MAG: Gfo/Idh/MocA family oxidoreductase [Planctomycetota bacterium]